MARNKNLLQRLEQIENRSCVVVDNFNWEDHEPTPEEIFNEKHYHLISTGKMSWEEYWHFQREHGFHSEFKDYAEYRKDLLENGW